MKKTLLAFMGMLTLTVCHHSKADGKAKAPVFIAKTTAAGAVACIAPFYYYMFTKNPVVKPPKDYTLDTSKKKFWTRKNMWSLFDQWFIGQRFKAASFPIDSSLPKSPECLPTGIVGRFHENVVGIGGSAAESLLVLYALLNANNIYQAVKAVSLNPDFLKQLA